jgi:hypothetical protein
MMSVRVGRHFDLSSGNHLSVWFAVAIVLTFLMQVAVVPEEVRLGSIEAATPAAVPRAQAADFELPAFFEADKGQLPSGVEFAARSGDGALLLKSSGATLVSDEARLSMTFAGGDPQTRIVGAEPTATKVNYLIGRRSEWATRVPTFEAARYREIYPGIDAILYAGSDHFRYDFVVAARADPSQIGLRLSGATDLQITRDGALLASTQAGGLRHEAPFAYQIVDGERVEVPSGFVLDGGLVRFWLGDYDSSKRLVIDPDVRFSTFLGGDFDDTPRSLAVDSDGNSYLYGAASSVDLPTTSGAYQEDSEGPTACNSNPNDDYPPCTGGGGADDPGPGECHASTGSGTCTADLDAFVAKFEPNGDAVYVTYYGGSNTDAPPGLPHREMIGAGDDGEAVIVGQTSSDDLEMVNAYDNSCSDCGASVHSSNRRTGDAFVAKLTEGGDDLVYSTYLGGSTSGGTNPEPDDGAFGVAVDAAGNAFVTGKAESSDFPVTDGTGGAGGTHDALQDTYQGGFGDAFLTAFESDGDPIYSTYLGGSADEIGLSVSTAGDGNVLVGGKTMSGNFPTAGTIPANDSSFNGITDSWLAYFDFTADSGDLTYGSFFGGTSEDNLTEVEVRDGNLHAVGHSVSGASFVTLNAIDTVCSDDAWVAKIDLDGTDYVTCWGGSSTESGVGIGVDSFGEAWIGGFSASGDFVTTGNAFDPTRSDDEAYATRFDADGGLEYSTFLGGDSADQAEDVFVDARDAFYVTGWTAVSDTADFPTRGGSLTPYRGRAAFVTKFRRNQADPQYSSYLDGRGGQGGMFVVADDNGEAIVAGVHHSEGEGGELDNPNDPDEPGEPRPFNFPLRNAHDTEPDSDPDDDDLGGENEADEEAFLTRFCDGSCGGGGGGEITTVNRRVEMTPESADNTLPEDNSHTLSIDVDDAVGENEIDFKIISGPNAVGGMIPDFSCTLNAQETCTVTYTSNGQPGTDFICAWFDIDNDNVYDPAGSVEDGGECDTEPADEAGEGGQQLGDPQTDVVVKNWNVRTQCSDGIDNDGDGDIDYPADDGCESETDDDESDDPEEEEAEIPALCQNPPEGYNVIIGTNDDDRLIGTRRRDVICALAGDDIVRGRGRGDRIVLGPGDDNGKGNGGRDMINGDRGEDTIQGNRGADLLRGGKGDDQVRGGRGADRLLGHADNDFLHGGPHGDSLNGGGGTDRCVGARGRDTFARCESRGRGRR